MLSGNLGSFVVSGGAIAMPIGPTQQDPDAGGGGVEEDLAGYSTVDSAWTQSYLASHPPTGPFTAPPGGPPPSGPSPVIGLNGFDGVNNGNNPFSLSPPDSDGAIGPNSFIDSANVILQIFRKDGTPLTPATYFGNFFSPLGTTSNFSDPVVVYNDVTNRFFVGILDYDFNTNSSLLDVAISRTSDPGGLGPSDWNFYRYNMDDPTPGFDFADYPKVGFNADGYVVSTNQFPGGFSYDHAAVIAIGNDGSTTTGDQAIAVPRGGANFTLAPARMHGAAPGAPMWFVETPGSQFNESGSQVTVVRMDSPFGAAPTFTASNLNVNPFIFQPSPLGDRTGLGTRMYHSALRTVDGVTHLIAADSPGSFDASGLRSHVRWYDFNVTDPSNPALVQEGEINPGPGIDTYFPDADIGPDGSIGMTYSQSIPFGAFDPRAGQMDMYVTGRRPSDPAGTMQDGILAKAGTAILDAFGRAGDYSFTTVDPIDGSYWAVNEYSSSAFSPNWATWIQHFQVAGLSVVGSTPAAGSTVSAPPGSYAFTFSTAIDPSSLQASDLTVNGKPATSVTLSSDHTAATFTFASDPVTTQGLQTMAMAAGAVTKDGDPTVALAVYSASFRYDALLLQVTSTSPATPGGVFTLPGPFSLTVNFNEAVDPASVGTSDLALSGVPGATVLGASIAAGGKSATFTIGGITSEGNLSASLAAGAITDVYGNPGAAFAGSYDVDIGKVPYPIPLTSMAPPGSLIYDPVQPGLIAPAGDTDQFTISVDPGQTITLLLHTDASLKGAMTLAKGSAVVASAQASSAGADVVIQPVQVPGQLAGAGTPITYTITVSGLGGMTGNYTLKLLLNAALESESVGGTSNDANASAQDLSGGWITLNSAGNSGVQPARTAVVGSIAGNPESTVPNNLENVDNYWGNAFPFVLQPFGLSTMRYQQIYSSSQFASGGSINELRFRRAEFMPQFDDFSVDATIRLGYAARTYGGASPHFDDNLGSGVTTVFDGTLTLGSDTSAFPTNPFDIVAHFANGFAYDPRKGDLIAEIDIHGTSADVATYFSSTSPYEYSPTTRVYFPSDTATDGYIDYGYGLVTQFGFAPDATDTYKVGLSSGQSASVVLTNLGGADVQVALVDPSGNVVAKGAGLGATGGTKFISDFLVQSSGAYLLRVTSGGSAKYSLVVTRNATFGAEPNDTTAAARPILGPEVAATRWAMGSIQTKTAPLFTVDEYHNNTIQQVDPQTGAVLRTIPAPIPIGNGPDGLGFDGTYLYLVNSYYNDHLYQIDPSNGNVVSDTSLQSYGFLDGVAALNGKIYVTNSSTDQILEFDPTTHTVTRTLSPGVDLGGGLAGIKNPDALVATVGFSSVVLIDPKTGAVLSGFNPGLGTLLGVATGDDNTIYLGGFFNGIDAFSRTGQLIRSIPYYAPITALGGDDVGGGPEKDIYQISASAGAALMLETQTPASGSGQPANGLDPTLTLMDASGNVLATDDNGSSDGRNAKISYKIKTTGTYYVVVNASGATAKPTTGEYLLTVKGLTVTLPPFQATLASPSPGSAVPVPPSQVTVSFNDDVLLTTLQGSDLKVDGVAASSVTTSDGTTASLGTPWAVPWSASGGGNGHYYMLTSSAETWTQAEAEAEALGGHLVSVGSQAEQNFLKRVFFSGVQAGNQYWIGLNDIATPGQFVWSSGEPVTYTNWGPGEPNDYNGIEDAALIDWYSDVNNGAWNDYFHSGARYGIVELNAAPSGRWLATDGTHTVTMVAGAVQDVQGTPVQALTSTFNVDQTPPRILTSSIQQGQSVPYGDLTITIGFSEPMRTSINPYDAFALYGTFGYQTYYYPSSYGFDASGKTLTVSYSYLPEDALTFVMRAAAFRDTVGYELDGEATWPLPAQGTGDGVEGGDFVVSFGTDAPTRALPTPLVDVAPSGSQVSQTPYPSTGVIATPGDTDDFAITLEAGQVATIDVLSGSGLVPTVTFIGPGGVLGAGSAAFSGQEVVLQTLTAGSSNTYTVRIGGVAGSIGTYSVSLVVNAALESESHGGPANNDVPSAQAIDGSAIPSGSGDRLAVLGTSGDTDVYSFHLDAGQAVTAALAYTSGSDSAYARTDYSGYDPNSVALGDVNGDGKLDVVYSSGYTGYGPGLSVRLGDGQGNFGDSTFFGFGLYEPSQVVLADVNGDGKLDAIASDFYGAFYGIGGIVVALGNGDGTFGSAVGYYAGAYNSALAVGDVTGDGLPDIVTTDQYDDQVLVLPNLGNGMFGTPLAYPVGYGASSVALADFNGDGSLDMAVANRYDYYGLTVLFNDGTGGFNSSASYLPGGYYYYYGSVAATDLNGDGLPDIAAASVYGGVAVLTNLGLGSFAAPDYYGLNGSYYAYALAIGAMDGDGKPDLVVGAAYNPSFSGGSVVILSNDGTGHFGAGSQVDASYGLAALALGDLNGDGKLDVVTANTYYYSISALVTQTNITTLELIAPDGSTVLATSNPGSSGLAAVLDAYVVGQSGTYYLRITGPSKPRNYTLLVGRDASLSLNAPGHAPSRVNSTPPPSGPSLTAAQAASAALVRDAAIEDILSDPHATLAETLLVDRLRKDRGRTSH